MYVFCYLADIIDVQTRLNKKLLFQMKSLADLWRGRNAEFTECSAGEPESADSDTTIIVVLSTLVAYKEFISHSQHEDFFGHWHMLTDLVSCNKGGWISAKQI